MEGIKDVKSDGSLGDETEKGVVFIDLQGLPNLELQYNGKA